jgi:hypothetical protein
MNNKWDKESPFKIPLRIFFLSLFIYGQYPIWPGSKITIKVQSCSLYSLVL